MTVGVVGRLRGSPVAVEALAEQAVCAHIEELISVPSEELDFEGQGD